MFYNRWPAEPFSMLKSQDGCPEGFAESSLQQFTEPLPIMSDTMYSAVTVGSNNVTYTFCSKPKSEPLGPSSYWQKGSYCILSYTGICPTGKEGYLI